MEAHPADQAAGAAIEFKGAVFTLPVLHLRSVDLDAVTDDLRRHLARGLRFFDGAPVVLDLGAVRGRALAMEALLARLRELALVPVGVRAGDGGQHEQARALGLAVLQGGGRAEVPAGERPTRRQTDAARAPARVVEQPVRSGQQIYARGGDLILLAPVNPGAEVIADGSIHAYAPLRGRALAGVQGDVRARIFAQSMEAELVAVAGHFRVFEEALPEEIHRRPVQVYLDGERLMIRALMPWKDAARNRES